MFKFIQTLFIYIENVMYHKTHIVFIELVSMVLLLLILTIIITKKFPEKVQSPIGPESSFLLSFLLFLFWMKSLGLSYMIHINGKIQSLGDYYNHGIISLN